MFCANISQIIWNRLENLLQSVSASSGEKSADRNIIVIKYGEIIYQSNEYTVRYYKHQQPLTNGCNFFGLKSLSTRSLF